MSKTTEIEEYNRKNLFLKMGIVAVSMLLGVSIFAFSLKNMLSFIAGALISFINMYWMEKIILQLCTEGKISKKAGIGWGLKILFIFGSITILILKAPINILIFLLGLSILPVVVFFDSIKMVLKTFGGMKNGSRRS